MIIIGVDFHPEFQQIASVDTDTGEFQEKRLSHREEAEKFYRELAAAGQKVRVGMEASGHARWFERLLAELQVELWIGDAAEIRAKRVRKQKTDRQDAQLILTLMLEDRFPQIWVPSWENRDARQLLWHRHRLVQARTRINSLRKEGVVDPQCLMKWDQNEIVERLKSAGCDRGTFMTNLFALRLANLGALITGKGLEHCTQVISGRDTRAIEELLLPVNGIGPKVIANFCLLRDIANK